MENRATVMEMRSRMPRLLLVAVVFLVLLLLGFLLLSGYREQIRKAEIGTRNLAAILQTQLYDALRRTDADLAALASEISPEALARTAVLQYQQEINARLANRLINVERMNGLHVLDSHGVALYSSESVPARALSIADRDYFKSLRDDPSAGLVFSSVVKSGLSGKDVLVIARAIRNADGQFLGTVLSPFDLESYKEQLGSLHIGDKGFVALRRRDTHALVLRWPDAPDEVNKSLAPDHALVAALAEGAMDAVVQDGSEVAPDLVGYVTSLKGMPNYPFYFVVGFDRESVLAGWYSHVIVVCVAVLVVIAMVGILLLRLGRMREREAVILSNLAHSEARFSDLVQVVPVGISRFDEAGKCAFVNDRNLLITGREREDLIGSDWSELVHPDDRRRVRASWMGQGGSQEICISEYRLVRPNGETVYVIGEAKAEKDADGTVTGYIVVQTDISQLKRVERELLVAKQQAELSSQAKTRFLAAASHDLRQPIQAINLFKDALGRTGLNDEQEKIARFLSLSVRSLSELLYSLLDISKLDAGLVQPRMKMVEVEDIFKAVDEEFSSLAQQRNLRFKFSYPFRAPILQTDAGLLLSVLRNLIDNAFKYTNTGGVLVGFRRRGTFGVIQVWDTGIGIDPVFGERIFEECFQVGNPARDRTKGLGIGLSIARRTARLLGGDVTYRSRPGKGSLFEIVVPVSVESHALPSMKAATGSLPHATIDGTRFTNWKVVVVEDDPVVAMSIQLSLQATGMQVELFSSAEEAIASPLLLGGDFYISDFVLPGMNGIQLLDAIQARSPVPIKAILMTGETASDRIQLTKASGWKILFKPAGLARLLSVMDDVVNAHGMDGSVAAKRVEKALD